MVRRNYDEWHDTPSPETLEVPDDPPAASAAKEDQAQGSSSNSGIDRTANAVMTTDEKAANAAETRDVAFWANKGGAILEIYDGIPSLSLQCSSMGIDTCEPLQWPSSGVKRNRLTEVLVKRVKQQAPEVLCVTPSSPCHLDSAVWAATHQKLQGKFLLFIPSNVKECWNHQLMRKLWSSTKTQCVKLAPKDRNQERTWYLIHNCFTVPWQSFVQKELRHCTLFPERRARGMNRKVCERVAEAIRADVQSCGSSASLVEDLLSEETAENFEEYATWLVSRESNVVLAAQAGKHFLSGKQNQIVADITDSKIKNYMTYLERMSRGTEIMLHLHKASLRKDSLRKGSLQKGSSRKDSLCKDSLHKAFLQEDAVQGAPGQPQDIPQDTPRRSLGQDNPRAPPGHPHPLQKDHTRMRCMRVPYRRLPYVRIRRARVHYRRVPHARIRYARIPYTRLSYVRIRYRAPQDSGRPQDT